MEIVHFSYVRMADCYYYYAHRLVLFMSNRCLELRYLQLLSLLLSSRVFFCMLAVTDLMAISNFTIPKSHVCTCFLSVNAFYETKFLLNQISYYISFFSSQVYNLFKQSVTANANY